MKQYYLILLAFVCLSAAGHTQNERWRNKVLAEGFGAITFHQTGAPLSLPIVNLSAPKGILTLQFDLLGDEPRDYIYRIEHCDANWERSDLTEDEYLRGFREPRIRDYEGSVRTLKDYFIYTLQLPNDDMEWTKSGNYILNVYDVTDEEQLVITQRFCVVETGWVIAAQFVRPNVASKDRTHHEIDFDVDPKLTRIVSPQTDIKAVVMKNGRWDSAIGPIKPLITRGNKQIFDYQDLVVFPAGKESRFFDMRTFDFRKERVQRITQMDDYYEVVLREDQDRSSNNYIFYPDANGQFVISNETQNRSFVECDYGKVLFRLQAPVEIEGRDVYILGAFNDYAIDPRYRMDYSAAEGTYFKELMMKQGYYNYEYVVVNRATGQIDPDNSVEGDAFEAVNDYQILVYYRGLSERYDRLMEVTSFSSRPRN